MSFAVNSNPFVHPTCPLRVIDPDACDRNRTLNPCIPWNVMGHSNISTYPSKHKPLKPCAFPIHSSINKKICLWNGPIWCLKLDALVNSTNETLSDTTGISGLLYKAAGKEIWKECKAAGSCRTGEVVMTRGCSLPAKHILHTVSPSYSPKYHTAAENALHGCYRRILTVAKEKKLESLALSCIYHKSNDYPHEDAVHIASRTVRRFLEHYETDFQLIVFCVNTIDDERWYQKILPLYFPRNDAEEWQSASALHARDLGDAMGEPIIEERKIRISALKSSSNSEAEQKQEYVNNLLSGKEKLLKSIAWDAKAMTNFCAVSRNPDLERLATLNIENNILDTDIYPPEKVTISRQNLDKFYLAKLKSKEEMSYE